jgi:DNA-binding Lrp family transcriptional regulator
MAIKAYVLMNLVSASVPETLKELRATKGVKFADAVTGPYDAIVQVEAQDMDDLGAVVTTKILKVKGVVKTLTCVAV